LIGFLTWGLRNIITAAAFTLKRDQPLNFQSKRHPFGLAVARNLHSKAFTSLFYDHVLEVERCFAKNTGIYFDIC